MKTYHVTWQYNETDVAEHKTEIEIEAMQVPTHVSAMDVYDAIERIKSLNLQWVKPAGIADAGTIRVLAAAAAAPPAEEAPQETAHE